MPVTLDPSYVSLLYSPTTSTATTAPSIISLDMSALLAPSTNANTPAVKRTPTAPWTTPPTAAQASAAVKAALSGKKLVNEDAAKLDVPGASADYKKLFALYQAMDTLSGVANQINAKGLSSVDKANIHKTFANGIAEVTSYVSAAKFDQLRLVNGEVAAFEKSALTVSKAATSYSTPPLTSSTTASVPAFEGPVRFNISIKRVNTTFDIPIDLAGMGAQERTIGNVVNYINDQLQTAGVDTRLGTQRIAGQPRTAKSGGKTITLTPSPDQWALQIKVSTSEAVTLSAPQTAGAVYLAQNVGDPDPDHKAATNDGITQRQLLKFQTDAATVPAPPQPAGDANWVDGRVFSETLGPEVKTVHATKVGPDGSVYMLADITAKTGDQAIKGAQDVALLKYDSAGALVYTRTLGAGGTATGLALAISDDGKIAVAGSVSGALDGAAEGPTNSGTTGAYAGKTDSFVTLYNPEGEELWTQRRGARQDDEASQVAFGADGAVYVAGRAASVMPGAGPIGATDSYIEGFKADATGKVQTLFTQSFGTAGADRPAGLVVDGSALVTASIEDGHAVLRRFDLSGGTPVEVASRDIGDLQGGDLAGLALDGGQIVLAGSTQNPGLAAGTRTNPNAGGVDAFAARLSANLAANPADAVAYYGGAGDDRATSLAVAGGKVWITGAAGTDLPGQPPVGTQDGFLAELDVATGAVDWSRRFTGKDGRATPSAIAVAPQGSSILDRLGLPSGLLDLTKSQHLTAVSSLRAGDQFTIKAGDGPAATVTIAESDTLDTLAQNIRRAAGFQVKVSISAVSGVRSLKIEPLNPRSIVTIGAGKTDKNALAMLGLPEGVVRATTVANGVTSPADGKAMLYGLALGGNLNLSSDEQVRHSVAELATAMGIVRTAYKGLVAAATPKSDQAAAKGPVPAYLTNQIANYQAALDRLTGGS